MEGLFVVVFFFLISAFFPLIRVFFYGSFINRLRP
jgi:hypothetical protein